jgi:hypothetical protein
LRKEIQTPSPLLFLSPPGAAGAALDALDTGL